MYRTVNCGHSVCGGHLENASREAACGLWLSPSHQSPGTPAPHGSLSKASLGTGVRCEEAARQDSEAEEKDQIPLPPCPNSLRWWELPLYLVLGDL